jgi:hypothetical protein
VKLPLQHQVNPSHHYGLWVGFNDLCPFQPNSSVVFCTGSSHWAKPPRLGEAADVVAFDAVGQIGTVVGHTRAVNYPVGARPQCVIKHGNPFYLVNNITNGLPCIDIYNSSFTHISSLVGFQHWCTSSDMSYSYCLDLHKTQRLGGYGYIFSPSCDSRDLYEYPEAVSAYCHRSGSHHQVLSTHKAAEAVANYLGVPVSTILPYSYLTHLLLSPCESKLACLFRCWLRDGGLLTALLTVDLANKGNDVNVELVGQLSHFMWLSKCELVIYAYQILTSNSLRIKLNSLSSFIPFSKAAKVAAKSLMSLKTFILSFKSKKKPIIDASQFPFQKSQSIPCFVYAKNGHVVPLDVALPMSDGHPSAGERLGTMIMVSDTYPNSSAQRCLFAINLPSGKIVFRKLLSEHRPTPTPVYSWVNRYSLLPHYAEFSIASQSFTRSGLHCDAHPFFNWDSSLIGYHTSRNGFRTIEILSV